MIEVNITYLISPHHGLISVQCINDRRNNVAICAAGGKKVPLLAGGITLMVQAWNPADVFTGIEQSVRLFVRPVISHLWLSR